MTVKVTDVPATTTAMGVGSFGDYGWDRSGAMDWRKQSRLSLADDVVLSTAALSSSSPQVFVENDWMEMDQITEV